MNTYIINNTYLICAESEEIAFNLAKAKFGEIVSVKRLGE